MRPDTVSGCSSAACCLSICDVTGSTASRGDFTCGGRMSLLGYDLQLAAGWPSGFDGSADDGYFLTALDILAAEGVIPIQRLGRHDD